MKKIFILLIILIFSPLGALAGNPYENGEGYDKALAERLHGRILLQIEEHGEAYYIRSKDSLRYYMKDGEAAYTMMRFFGLGITDADLGKIPSVADTSEMNASASVCSTNSLANRMKGEILLQVEQHGEAWYVDPAKCRRIYMKDGAAAYEIMRFLGLGILNSDLAKIAEGQMLLCPANPSIMIEDEACKVNYVYQQEGSGFTEPVYLKNGLLFLVAAHNDSTSDFAVELKSPEGETVQYWVNESGAYFGQRVYKIEDAGYYYITVETGGPWYMNIYQYVSDTIVSTGQLFEGSDLTIDFEATEFAEDDMIGPMDLSAGTHSISLSQEGSGDFIVNLIDVNGDLVEALAYGSGNVSYDKTFNISEAGYYFLAVQGNDHWTIEID